MEAEPAFFGQIKYLNLVKVHIEFHLVYSHVEAGMFSNLRVRTDT